MQGFRRVAVIVCASMLVMCLASAQNPPTPAKDEELNTALMESTFKIEGRNAQGQPTIGTAFIMGRPYPNQPLKARYVLITAAHVLEEMQGETALLHLRTKADDGSWTRAPFPLPIRTNNQALWRKHPDADVAVMYVRLPHNSIPVLPTGLLADDTILSDFEIHPGDELQCLGYPLGMEANTEGFPVLRSGKIASYPLLPTDRLKTFLFDFRVFKGNSGGPVYFVESTRTYGGVTHMETIHFIIGLVSGESLVQQQISGPYSEEMRQFQLGLAVVVHASLLKQAVNLLPSPETLPD
jgi:S1-C subfamily serine protease